MNENHRLIVDVSNALNHYVQIGRREQGFDLSGIYRPAYDLNRFRFNKLFGYTTGYDENLKRVLTSEIRLPKATKKETNEDLKLREQFYKDELKYHLKWEKNLSKSTDDQLTRRRFYRAKSHIDSENREKITAKIPVGFLTVRSSHKPNLSKKEKHSILDITTKIMSASSEICFPKEDVFLMKALAGSGKLKHRATCYSRKSRSFSRKRFEGLYPEPPQEVKEEEEVERFPIIRKCEPEPEPVVEAPSPPPETQYNESFEDSKQDDDSNRNIIIIPDADKEETPKRPSTSDDLQDLNDLPEVTSGETIPYKIIIKTGDRLGASTEAQIKLQMFGANGKSKVFYLSKSKTHRIPFRKGNTDVFQIETFTLGKLRAVFIGHDETSIEYNWFMDQLRIEDHYENVYYQFECQEWFGTSSSDGRTARFVKRKYLDELEPMDSLESTSSSSISLKSLRADSKKSNRHIDTTEDVPPPPPVLLAQQSQTEEAREEILNRICSRTSLIKVKAPPSSTSSRTSVRKQEVDSVSVSSSTSTTISLSRSSSPSSTSSSSDSSFYSKEKKPSQPSIKSKKSTSSSKSSVKRRQESAASAASASGDKPKSRTTSATNRKTSTSSSVRDAEAEITSRKFEYSPSPKSQLSSASNKRNDFSVQVINTTKVKLNAFEAVEMNQLNVLKEIIEESPEDIRRTDSSGNSLMIVACEKGYDTIVRYLADANESLLSNDTPSGLFPVHVCAQHNHLNCLQILYEYGASLQSKTIDGQTPLHYAAKFGNFEIVQWLMSHNAKLDIVDGKNETAYDFAKRSGHLNIANFLADPTGKPHLSSYSSRASKLSTIENETDLEINEKNLSRKSPYLRPESPTPKLRTSDEKKLSASPSKKSANTTRNSSLSSSSSDSESAKNVKAQSRKSSSASSSSPKQSNGRTSQTKIEQKVQTPTISLPKAILSRPESTRIDTPPPKSVTPSNNKLERTDSSSSSNADNNNQLKISSKPASPTKSAASRVSSARPGTNQRNAISSPVKSPVKPSNSDSDLSDTNDNKSKQVASPSKQSVSSYKNKSIKDSSSSLSSDDDEKKRKPSVIRTLVKSALGDLLETKSRVSLKEVNEPTERVKSSQSIINVKRSSIDDPSSSDETVKQRKSLAQSPSKSPDRKSESKLPEILSRQSFKEKINDSSDETPVEVKSQHSIKLSETPAKQSKKSSSSSSRSDLSDDEKNKRKSPLKQSSSRSPSNNNNTNTAETDSNNKLSSDTNNNDDDELNSNNNNNNTQIKLDENRSDSPSKIKTNLDDLFD